MHIQIQISRGGDFSKDAPGNPCILGFQLFGAKFKSNFKLQLQYMNFN